MATVEEVAALALSAIDASADTPIGIEQCGRWVANRYAEIVGKTRFRHRRRLGVITIPDAVNTGTATVTAGATTLTLDATAQAAVTAAGGQNVIANGNWFIRLGTVPGSGVWYRVTAYVAPTLTIANPYTGDTVTDTAFVLLPRFHTLEADARWLGKFVYPALRRPLQMRAFVDFDRLAPDRILDEAGPWFVAEAANTVAQTSPVAVTGGIKRVELYPYKQVETTIYYTYWSLPILTTDPVALLAVELPQEIDPHVLREGVLIDLYRYRMSQALNKGATEAAGFWRNEMRAQMTSWEKQIEDAARTDRGMDDVSFILHACGLGAGRYGATGDTVYDGWSQWVQYGWPNLSGGSS